MPIEPRPSDNFTKDALLLGFSFVDWYPKLSDGSFGTPVPLGILSGQELQKEVNVITLPDGSSGISTTAREVLSSLAPSFQFEVFNFRADIAQYIFGAASLTNVVADAAAVVTNELFNVPNAGADSERQFADLANGDIDESSIGGSDVTCGPITDEAVGTGDGTTGDGSGDFSLDYKPLIVADVTSVTVDGVAYTPVAVAAAASGNEVEVVVGTGATSGDLQFFQGGSAVNVTGAILATYTPSHTFANLTDYVVDPWLGRIRMLNVDGATDALKSGQPMNIDYEYSRKSGVSLQPFTQGGGAFQGKAVIRHLPDVGINFRWDIPSATIRIDDNALTFGSDDFATGTLVLGINDAGGNDRFGTMTLSNETQAA